MLGGVNTYTGNTTISGGTLKLATGGSISGSRSIVDNATLEYASTGSLTDAHNITGTGAVVKSNAGSLSLSGATNAYSGATTITGGTLTLSGSGTLNASSGITINGSGAKYVHTSSVAGTTGITLTQGTLDGTGSVGAVTVADLVGNTIANGNGASTTALTVGSPSLGGDSAFSVRTAGSAGVVITGALTTTPANGTVVVNATNASWVNGTTYNLVTFGSGGGLLSDYTQGTIANLSARQSAALGLAAGAITLDITGDTVTWTGAASTAWTTNTIGSPFNWQTTVGLVDTEYLTGDDVNFTDAASGAGTVTVDISTADVAPASVTFSNATRDYNITGSGGEISGTTGVTKSGAANTTINTNNTYSGITTVNGGTLVLSGNNSGNGAYTVNGGTLQLTGANTGTGLTTINSGTAILSGGNIRILSGNSVVLGASGKLVLGDGSGTSDQTLASLTATAGGSVVGGNAANSVLTLSSSSPVTYAGALGGAGTNENKLALAKAGAGTLTLSAASTYTGGTTVSGGIVNANNNNAFGTGAVSIGSAAIRINAADGVNIANTINIGATTGGVTGRGVIEYGGATSATYSGPINITGSPSAGGTFASTSTGVLNLTGTITATVNVNQRLGIVVYSGVGSSFAAGMNLSGTAKLGADNGLATNAAVIIGASVAGTFDLTGFNQTFVSIAKGGAAATITNSTAATASTLTTTGISIYSGLIQNGAGTTAITVNGGSLSLTGNTNSYSGATTVTSGTLLANNTTGSATGTSAVTVNGGTLGGSGIISGAVTVNSGAILAPGNSVGTISTGNLRATAYGWHLNC